jgi:hypothetical protein
MPANDIQMEHLNLAQQQTNLVAQSQDRSYSGDFVFAVGVDKSMHPLTAVNGFSAEGWREGAGVKGFGGKISGVGVSGEGGGDGTGVSGKGGQGGKGVEATGGEAMPMGVAGSGVEAVGGVSDRTRGPDAAPDSRDPNAPGVVARSAVSDQKITLAETGNVGVFGQGGDQADDTMNDGTHTNFTVGPFFAGAGVIGRGGVRMTNNGVANHALARAEEPGSAGIVGISGNTKTPTPDQYVGAGVFGISDSGRGGIFHSKTEAQLNLVPVLKSLDEVTPGKSRIGDLLVTINPRDEARGNVPTAQLWFCDLIDTNGQPNWQRVAFVP